MVKDKKPAKLSVGAMAPDFSLRDESGKTVDLSGFRGKKNVVLVFYPGDMTPGCTVQLCAVRDDWSKFEAADAVVFGINHGDTDSHQRFKRAYDFPFPLLIDTGKKTSEKFGALKTLFGRPVIKRTVIVIDKEGKIVFLKSGMPKHSDILKAIK
ncbi:MAG: peroxiredoxin [Patescibacteria group bacterium]|nr:peroxiredoxin [Patescibacteria group bacterium]